MSGTLATSPRLACLLSVLKGARGKRVSNSLIIRRMTARGYPPAALHSDINDLRRDPALAALGLHIPRARVEVLTDRTTGGKRRQYSYCVLPLEAPAAPAPQGEAA